MEDGFDGCVKNVILNEQHAGFSVSADKSIAVKEYFYQPPNGTETDNTAGLGDSRLSPTYSQTLIYFIFLP